MEGLDADDVLKKAAEAAANPEPVAGDKRKRSTSLLTISHFCYRIVNMTTTYLFIFLLLSS
jgi:hypothetical protein